MATAFPATRIITGTISYSVHLLQLPPGICMPLLSGRHPAASSGRYSGGATTMAGMQTVRPSTAQTAVIHGLALCTPATISFRNGGQVHPFPVRPYPAHPLPVHQAPAGVLAHLPVAAVLSHLHQALAVVVSVHLHQAVVYLQAAAVPAAQAPAPAAACLQAARHLLLRQAARFQARQAPVA